MEKKIRMPNLSPDMQKGVLVAWTKAPGDAVKKGDVLFEVETEKVVSEVEANEDGVLGAVYFEEGDEVAVDETVALLETDNG